MTLRDILIFASIGLIVRALSRWGGLRAWLLYVLSILAVFWLQPLSPVRNLDFWLPLATLALAALGWVATTPPEQRAWRVNAPALGALAGIVLAVGLTRFVSDAGLITAARPPLFEWVAAGVAIVALLGLGLSRLKLKPGALWVGIGLLIALLVVIKLPSLATAASLAIRDWVGQGAARAAATDLRWLGFSYVAFRLIHTLRDRQNGRLAPASFQEYLTFVLFFPAFTAGPIDRLDRFVKDLRKPVRFADADELGAAGRRLALGLLKKFVIADGLALFALNASNAVQVSGAGWTWILVYAYALQIFFDFAGYTDLAVGLGRLLGVTLPENFNSPYLKPNLTQFWNNWHMTLTQWFRAYWFNPLTRSLRSAKKAAAPRQEMGIGGGQAAFTYPPAPSLKGGGVAFSPIFRNLLSKLRKIGIKSSPLPPDSGGRGRGIEGCPPTNTSGEVGFSVTREPPEMVPAFSPAVVLFITQMSTFLLIGLWHGMTWNFVLWGAWHGAGLLVQNRFTDWMKPRYAALADRPRLHSAVTVLTTLVTFHYVALGWVFFALPDPGLSLQVFGKLFGGF